MVSSSFDINLYKKAKPLSKNIGFINSVKQIKELKDISSIFRLKLVMISHCRQSIEYKHQLYL